MGAEHGETQHNWDSGMEGGKGRGKREKGRSFSLLSTLHESGTSLCSTKAGGHGCWYRERCAARLARGHCGQPAGCTLTLETHPGRHLWNTIQERSKTQNATFSHPDDSKT